MEALASTAEDIEWILVEESSAPGRVRRAATALAVRLGFSEHRTGEVAIAVTELATNLHLHATEGTVLLRVRRAGDDAAVEIVAIDNGPGIADLRASAKDGTSTGGTLGIGIGAVLRMATWFDCHSIVGRGTVMIATFWRDREAGSPPAVGGLTRAMNGEFVCGDALAHRATATSTTLLLADGLGHGEFAALASQRAVRAFLGSADELQPARAVALVNDALRGTRGAAAAVVRIDTLTATVSFAGVGNVAVWIDDGERRHGMVSQAGIVGTFTRVVREASIPLTPRSLVVVHSDGLTSKWNLDTYPGLRSRDPHLVAATLMRDAGVHRDDASVLVARAS